MLRALTTQTSATHEVGAFRAWALLAACTAIGASIAHVALLASPGHSVHGPLAIAMAISCAICAARCLRRPCAKELKVLLAMAVGMVFVHLAIIAVPTRLSAGHTHAVSSMSSADSALAIAGMASVEVVVAGLCAVGLRTARQSRRYVERGA